jgi:hypothetical protein
LLAFLSNACTGVIVANRFRRGLAALLTLSLSLVTLAATSAPAQASGSGLPLVISGNASCYSPAAGWRVEWVLQARGAHFAIVELTDPVNQAEVIKGAEYGDQARASAFVEGTATTAALTATVRFDGHADTDVFSISFPLGRTCGYQTWDTCTATPHYVPQYDSVSATTTVLLDGPPACDGDTFFLLGSDFFDVTGQFSTYGWTWMTVPDHSPYAVAFVPAPACQSHLRFYDAAGFTQLAEVTGVSCFAPIVYALNSCPGGITVYVGQTQMAVLPLVYRLTWFTMQDGQAVYTYGPPAAVAPSSGSYAFVPNARDTGATVTVPPLGYGPFVWSRPETCGMRRTGPSSPPPVVPRR